MILMMVLPLPPILTKLMWYGGLATIAVSGIIVWRITTKEKKCWELDVHPIDKVRNRTVVYRAFLYALIKVSLVDFAVLLILLGLYKYALVPLLAHAYVVWKYDETLLLIPERVCVSDEVEVEASGLKGTVLRMYKRAYKAITVLGPAYFVFRDYQMKTKEEIEQYLKKDRTF